MSTSEEANSSRGDGASVGAAVAIRFPTQERRRRWGRCWIGLSCFGSQKRGKKRVVPASRLPEGSPSANRANASQTVGLHNQATTLAPSLLAPPSSPASFMNSALPSTVQSPNSYLSVSVNSPGGPSNMFATGPYAHETQLVSPPVFSTFTTEPSTAPFTPPPELAHLTTPSSPDVPFAQFLYSSFDLKSTQKEGQLPLMSSCVSTNDLQASHQLCPESPASSLVSPMSGTSEEGLSAPSHDRVLSAPCTASGPDHPLYPRHGSKLFPLGSGSSRSFMLSEDSSFLPSAQFYLDQAHCGSRLSLSHEDVYSNMGNGHHRHSNAEEIEAYRASFGFSADEIISTPQYVDMADALDDSFTITPFTSNKHSREDFTLAQLQNLDGRKADQSDITDAKSIMAKSSETEVFNAGKMRREVKSGKESNNFVQTSEDDLISRTGDVMIAGSRSSGLSLSDAEIDYGRCRKGCKHDSVWC